MAGFRGTAFPLAMAVWVLLVLANYFHGWDGLFGPRQLAAFFPPIAAPYFPFLPERLFQLATRLVLVGLFDIASLMVGFRLAGFMGGAGSRSLPVALSLGFGATAIFMLGLGLAGLWFPAAAVLALFAGWAIPSRGGWSLLKPVRGWRPGVRDLVLLGALPATLVTLAGALAPESAFDPLRCYLGLPKMFIASHRITLVEHYAFSSYPLNGGMLFGAMKMVAGDGFAKIFNWHLLFGCGALAASLAGGGKAGRLGFLLFVSVPVVWLHASKAFSDLLLVFFQLSALSLLLAPGRPALSRMLVAGVLCGLSAGTKYTAVHAAVPMLAMAAFVISGRACIRRSLALFAAGAGAVFLPWFGRNWLYMGNPFYPLLSAFIPSIDSSSVVLANPFFTPGAGLGGWTGVSPWTMFLVHDRYDWFRLGPAILAAMPVLALVPAGRGRLLAGYAILYFISWMAITGCLVRYLIPAMPAFFGACAIAMVSSRPWGKWARGMAACATAFVAIGGAYLGVYAVASRQKPFGYAAGMMDEAAQLSQAIPNNWRIMRGLNAELPASGRFYSYGELVVYYARAIGHADFELDVPLFRRIVGESWAASDVGRKMRQRGFDGFLYSQPGGITQSSVSNAKPFTIRELAVWQEFIRTHARVVFRIEDEKDKICSAYYAFSRVPNPGGRLEQAGIWLHLPGAEGILAGGDRAYSTGDFLAAERLYREAAAVYPGYAWAWQRVGGLLKEMGRKAEAEKYAAKARKLGG